METITWLIHGFLWGKGTPFDEGDKVYILYALRTRPNWVSLGKKVLHMEKIALVKTLENMLQ